MIKDLEAMIEFVPFTSIQPSGGESANGVGDVEATLAYLVLDEKEFLPAIAVAGEVKFPTANNNLIGSGEFDYRPILIFSKRIADIDLHFNIGYNFIGEPSGVRTKNPIDLEFAAEWFVSKKFDLLAEITYIGSSFVSSSSGESSAVPESSATPEIAGEEIVGTVGVRFHFTQNLDLFGTFSYDNNDAKLFRTGISLKF